MLDKSAHCSNQLNKECDAGELAQPEGVDQVRDPGRVCEATLHPGGRTRLRGQPGSYLFS